MLIMWIKFEMLKCGPFFSFFLSTNFSNLISLCPFPWLQGYSGFFTLTSSPILFLAEWLALQSWNRKVSLSSPGIADYSVWNGGQWCDCLSQSSSKWVSGEIWRKNTESVRWLAPSHASPPPPAEGIESGDRYLLNATIGRHVIFFLCLAINSAKTKEWKTQLW